MLFCGTGVDLGDVKSFRAEGAQLQTLGSYQMAVFMAFRDRRSTSILRSAVMIFTFPGLIFAGTPGDPQPGR